MIRQAKFAGQFYPGSPEQLKMELQGLIPDNSITKKVIGVVSPHAGYVYSGRVTGRLLASVEIPSTVILLGPNHRGAGALAALAPEHYWQTPLGLVQLDKKLAGLIKKHLPVVTEDSLAHANEHSLEVQLPFLQYLRHDLKIVPISMAFGDYAGCEYLGKGLADAIKESGENPLILASSDMNHYESDQVSRQKDSLVLERLLAFDPQGMLEAARSKKVTMCGVVPTAVMLIAARQLGATTAELTDYTNSGEVNGDMRQVVGYAGVRIY